MTVFRLHVIVFNMRKMRNATRPNYIRYHTYPTQVPQLQLRQIVHMQCTKYIIYPLIFSISLVSLCVCVCA